MLLHTLYNISLLFVPGYPGIGCCITDKIAWPAVRRHHYTLCQSITKILINAKSIQRVKDK